jgi:hypothetical protein
MGRARKVAVRALERALRLQRRHVRAGVAHAENVECLALLELELQAVTSDVIADVKCRSVGDGRS